VVPALVLLVRAFVLGFETLFRRSQGEAPPALLASVVAVLLYGVGGGVIAHRWLGFDLTPSSPLPPWSARSSAWRCRRRSATCSPGSRCTPRRRSGSATGSV
jgi:hypothetical protein